ncbi:MAG: hypothetical protein ACOX6N_03925 [Patescibacteria group bacterium]|jgi:hypothetical protein
MSPVEISIRHRGEIESRILEINSNTQVISPDNSDLPKGLSVIDGKRQTMVRIGEESDILRMRVKAGDNEVLNIELNEETGSGEYILLRRAGYAVELETPELTVSIRQK